MSPAIQATAVAKVYGGPRGTAAVAALDGVDVAIDPGECVALMGVSGSGKSTLLHLMGTLERPTRGTVRVLGEDASRLSDRALSGLRAHRLGFVFQQFFLLEHLNVQDNVAQGLLYRSGSSRRQRRLAAAEALDRVAMGHRLRHRPAELSGGERQRVAIARAVVGRPAVVLADEPTGNLDSANGQRIVALLRSLVDGGTALVIATHDAGVAAAMDREIHLRDGRVVPTPEPEGAW